MLVRAKLPCTVLEVRTAPGHCVTAGDVVVMVESMEMELSVTAPADGEIVVVLVEPGQLLTPGQPVVELD